MILQILVSLWCVRANFCADNKFLQRAERAISELVIEDHLFRRMPELMSDVERALQKKIWPDCRVVAYGSIISNIGMRGSDIDLTVLMPVDNGVAVDETNLVLRARRAFKKYPHIFGNYFVPDAKVNVLQCIHLPTGIPIDLSFGKLMSIQNTLMNRYFINLDRRAFQMAILVKRWGRVYGLKIHQLFTNYNIILLIIFYLQQEKVLPPVSLLQKHAEPYYIGGWNTAFREVEYHTNNTKSLYKLLGGFFEYYSSFDYDTYVISVFAGYPVAKSAFRDLDKLPAEFALYKHNVQNNVSTPLDLSGQFIMLECFDFNNKAGTLLNLQQLKNGAEAYRKYNSTLFFEYLLSDEDYLITFTHK